MASITSNTDHVVKLISVILSVEGGGWTAQEMVHMVRSHLSITNACDDAAFIRRTLGEVGEPQVMETLRWVFATARGEKEVYEHPSKTEMKKHFEVRSGWLGAFRFFDIGRNGSSDTLSPLPPPQRPTVTSHRSHRPTPPHN